jgi:hypothetical protein
MKHYLILALLLVAAAVCYVVGLINGSIGLSAAAALLELSFWSRLFKRRQRTA